MSTTRPLRTDGPALCRAGQQRGTQDSARRRSSAGGQRGPSVHHLPSVQRTAFPQFQGMDLIAMPERLQPDWFQAFLLDPTAFRPGIVMPAYWPGGEATATHILEGQTQTQLQALWTYLTLGRSARDPVGIRSQGSRLTVTGRPLTHRGRSQVAVIAASPWAFLKGFITPSTPRPEPWVPCGAGNSSPSAGRARIGAVQPHRAANQPAPRCRLPSPERARRALAASPPNHQGSPGEPRPALPQAAGLSICGL